MNKLSLVFISTLILHSACTTTSTKYFIHNITKPNKDLQLKQSNVVVVANNKVLLMEYAKKFNEKYPVGKEQFVYEYVQRITDKLKTNGSFSSAKIDKSPQWALMQNSSPSIESTKMVDSLITSTEADYVLRIYNFAFQSRVRFYGTGATSNREETCVVKAQFQLIDVKTKQLALEFTAQGEDQASLSNYERVLDRAILMSIDHAAEYLNSGRVEFEYTVKW